MFIRWLCLLIALLNGGMAYALPLNDPNYPLMPIKKRAHSSHEAFLIMQDTIMDLPLGIVPSYKAVESKRTLTDKERVDAMNKARRVFNKAHCIRQDQYLPPLDPDAEQWFQQARALEKEARDRTLTEADKTRVFALYQNAARKKHWKAMNNLGLLYQEGYGTEQDYDKAIDLFEEMIALNIPAGFYHIFRALDTGMGVRRDDEAATQYLYKAVSLGSPEAQYWLGSSFTGFSAGMPIGVGLLDCALSQGHWQAGRKLSTLYDAIIQNYPKAAFYDRATGALGDSQSLNSLRNILTYPQHGYNLDNNDPLIQIIDGYYKQASKNPDLRFPNLIKEVVIPDHPYMGQGEDIPDDTNHDVLKRMMIGKIQGKNWREIPPTPTGKYPELKEFEAEHPWLKE